MTEERKFAILMAATIISARKIPNDYVLPVHCHG
jgi:hypothetical protein